MGFTVDPENLIKIGNKFDELAGDFDSHCKGLQDEATTMGENYQSDDNRQFVSRVESLCEDLARFKTKLETTAETLRVQAKLYKDREEENVGYAGKLADRV